MSVRKVLLASAEAHPFAKVGGLADVIGALTMALRQNGVDARVALPKYSIIDEKKFKLHFLLEIPEIPLGDRRVTARVYESTEPYPAYFFEGGDFFNRAGIYTDEKGTGYPDEPLRFTFFVKAILEALPRLGFKPDLIHANDSHTALIPALLQLKYNTNPFFSSIGTLFTIHNIAYQGNWDPSILDIIGVGHDQFYPMGGFEFYGKVNFMKIGIVYADAVSTVSPTYAREIMSSSEYGYGLEGVLAARSNRVFGILNGIDYAEWDPQVDTYLPVNYSAKSLEKKAEIKYALLKELKLDLKKKDAPLFGVVSRLVEQKGIELICEVLPKIFELGGLVVILGTGAEKYHIALGQIKEAFPGSLSLNLKFDVRLSHLIEAGADFFLMPSKYEPCGLNQMYSLRYGTLPIVRRTGGLADTVLDYTEHPDDGYGFVFETFSAPAFWKAIESAFELYRKPEKLDEVRRRAMKLDFSWKNSVLKYMELYDKIYLWHNR